MGFTVHKVTSHSPRWPRFISQQEKGSPDIVVVRINRQSLNQSPKPILQRRMKTLSKFGDIGIIRRAIVVCERYTFQKNDTNDKFL